MQLLWILSANGAGYPTIWSRLNDIPLFPSRSQILICRTQTEIEKRENGVKY